MQSSSVSQMATESRERMATSDAMWDPHGYMEDGQQEEVHEAELLLHADHEQEQEQEQEQVDATMDECGDSAGNDGSSFLLGFDGDDGAQQQREGYDGYGEEEDGEDESEEEDDDRVHRSWSTEKEPLASRRSDVDEEEDEEEGEEDGESAQYEQHYRRFERHDDDDDDEDDSADEELLELHFRSERAMQWSIPKKWASSSSNQGAPTQESMDRVEASVRAAMSVLNGDSRRSSVGNNESRVDGSERDGEGSEDDGDGASRRVDDENEEEEEQYDDHDEWKLGYGEDGKPFYYDIVHEAMEARWSHEDSHHDGHADENNQSMSIVADEQRDDEEDGNYEQDEHRDERAEYEESDHGEAYDEEEQADEEAKGGVQDTAQQVLRMSYFTASNLSTAEPEDEWQEAYTAKGRVYYYNRRTRESSWKKPANFVSRPQQSRDDLGTSSLFSVSRSSTVYTNVGHENIKTTSRSVDTQNFIFCSFCGDKLVGAAMKTHFKECRVQELHKQNRTDLYKTFEEMLCLMSEDTTLRSLHYASSFPDVKPVAISATSLASYEDRDQRTSSPSVQGSIQDSLFLLRRQRRSGVGHAGGSRESECSGANQEASEFQNQQGRLNRASSAVTIASVKSNDSSTASSRRKASAGSANEANASRSNPSRQRQAVGHYQESETCRYCGRSFAEGRLAKHEAVCPRVFGNEGSWGRGMSSPAPTTPRSSSSPLSKVKPGRILPKKYKSMAIEKRNLELSYKEHQATLVSCPMCKRKFAPSGAQQHIDICKTVQNRPKNPISLMKDYAIAG